MKQTDFPRNQEQTPAGESREAPVANPNPKQDEIDFVPSPAEVSRKAYFSYVNQGSQPEHEVQHWLEAERQLISDHKRTHNRHN